ncbi:MAG: M48 family metallopeptidase [Actinomycetota bacterium]
MAAINFQEHQHQARQSTVRLFVLFGLGLIAIILVVSFLIGLLFGSQGGEADPLAALAVGAPLTTIGVVGTSLVKSNQIKSGGGSYVAQSLGGRPVDFNTLDPAEKQLANVVEEIAIASGMPVPAVFVLDEEDGINAFAAGWSPDNAAIGVTRGALQHFTRNELQGVIAHEFAHIANGDTRVKTRIIGWVFGIAAITVLGRILLHSSWWAPRSRNSRDNSAAALLAVGLGLLAVGFVGTLFGRMVQAAVSRQREYLADASAVQYTRDPSSIGDALKKIAAFGADNRMKAAHATETQHLFFASALGGGFATHPPLQDRIKRLLPDWDGSLPTIDRTPERAERRPPGRPERAGRDMVPGLPGFPGLPGAAGLAGAAVAAAPPSPSPPPSSSAGDAIAGVELGVPSEAHIEHARAVLARIPESTQAYLHTRQGAVAAVLGLLASKRPEVRDRQLSVASEAVGMDTAYLDQAATVINDLDRSLHLPAVDIALHSIGELPYRFKQELIRTIREMDDDPGNRDLFRWVMRRAVIRHISDQDSAADDHSRYSLDERADDAATLLGIVAHLNSSGPEESGPAFAAALDGAGLPTRPLTPMKDVTFDDLDDALSRLVALEPAGRRALVTGAAAAVLLDERTTVEEAELIRVIADAVRLPVPLLLPEG